MEVTAIVVLLFLYLPFLLILDGWVLSKLWLWFVVPTFHVVPLTIYQAIGLSLIINFWLNKEPNRKKEVSKTSLLRPVIGLLLTLLIGWVIHNF